MNTERIDVLAVMDAEIARSSNLPTAADPYVIERHHAMVDARAAVAELMRREAVQAELIADLRVQCVRNLELGAYGVGYWEDALESIDAALARVQGGAP